MDLGDGGWGSEPVEDKKILNLSKPDNFEENNSKKAPKEDPEISITPIVKLPSPEKSPRNSEPKPKKPKSSTKKPLKRTFVQKKLKPKN